MYNEPFAGKLGKIPLCNMSKIAKTRIHSFTRIDSRPDKTQQGHWQQAAATN